MQPVADNIIKVWRLYPYCQEALAPLMSFYCGHTPVHMSVMRTRLAVAFQEHSVATYTTVIYDLTDKSKFMELSFLAVYLYIISVIHI